MIHQRVVQFSDDTLRELDHERWQKRRYEKWIGRKLWNEDLISIDTSKAAVAEAAIEAGADIVNDVTGMRDAEMVMLCSDAGVGV